MPVQVLDEFSHGTPGGVCFVCKASRRTADKVLDFFVDVDALNWIIPSPEYLGWEIAGGYLQICSSCVGEAANLLGMISADKAANLFEANGDLQMKLLDARAKIERLETAVSSLRALDA